MTDLRRDIISGHWIITGTRDEQWFLKQLSQERETILQCPYCAGAELSAGPEIDAFRADGSEPNDSQWNVRVISIDRGVLVTRGEPERRAEGIYDVMNNIGSHELIVETPEHIKNLSRLSAEQIQSVLMMYKKRITDLKADDRLRYCVIFKNQRPVHLDVYGHAQSQLVALPLTPESVKKELDNAREYYDYKQRCVFCDVIREEMMIAQRIVEENSEFLSYVPFAPRFAFESWICPKRHNADFTQETDESLLKLAQILKHTLMRIEALLNDAPLTFVLHSIPYMRPKRGYWKTIHKDYHWHIEILPHLMEVEGFMWSSGFYNEPLMPEYMTQKLVEVKIEK